MKRTIKEIAAELSVDDATATHLVKALLGMMYKGVPLARCDGERPSASGHGPKVYTVSDDAPAAVKRMLVELL